MTSAAPGHVTFVIDNRSYSAATIHLFRGGERLRLGTVEALNEATFRAEWPNPFDMQLQIRLLAGPSCLTRALPVAPGETIEVQIENDLARDMDCMRIGQGPVRAFPSASPQ